MSLVDPYTLHPPQGGGGPTTYVLDNFVDTAETLLTDHTPDTDVEAGGWITLGGVWEINPSGTLIETNNGSHQGIVIDVGASSVRVEWQGVMARGTASGRWNGITILGNATSLNDALFVRWVGGGAAPDLEISDGTADTRHTWDLDAALSAQPVQNDTVGLAVEYDAATGIVDAWMDIGSGWESCGAGYDLDADARTVDHGSQTHFGLYDNERQSDGLVISFTVTSL